MVFAILSFPVDEFNRCDLDETSDKALYELALKNQKTVTISEASNLRGVNDFFNSDLIDTENNWTYIVHKKWL